jgi:hypothetical protein
VVSDLILLAFDKPKLTRGMIASQSAVDLALSGIPIILMATPFVHSLNR